MKAWKYYKQKSADFIRDVPLRPDKQVDHNRCDKCGTLSPTELRTHNGAHVCMRCKINLLQ